jgi:acetoin utilization deacetylase AcuC-like enzyme
MGSTAFLYDPVFLAHRTGPMHPEKPERLSRILAHFEANGLLAQLIRLAPRAATPAEIGLIHDAAYIHRLETRCASGRMFHEDADTPGSPATYRAACLAAGAVLTAADAVMAGRAGTAFCAVRPPGHHALRERAMGFCFFNNVAIGARYLQTKHGVERIAIVDWDLHHGNGTQDAFFSDATVLYASTHQFPLFPGSGRRSERGAGAGQGFTLNIPLAAGSGDTDYLRVFREEIAPAIRKFQPGAILISAGFDAYIGDPLGGMQVTAEGFAALTRELVAAAKTLCQGRIISVLEGGYDLEGLPACVAAHVQAFHDF